ncbi:hypothetical protein ACFWDI_28370 [Streptomyces sp. NPDC060064]|uniref:hypothetical protein n=1 Tax=Streptomyces sp. NPDC060064 TaxID=3347049 RepID=UPI00369633DC
MRALANTKVSVLTGTSTDEWGDTVDGATVSASAIPASLIEKSRLVTTPEQSTPRVIRYTIARLPSNTTVGAEDRIRDDVTGTVYAITSVTAPSGVGHTPDLRLDLKRVT